MTEIADAPSDYSAGNGVLAQSAASVARFDSWAIDKGGRRIVIGGE